MSLPEPAPSAFPRIPAYAWTWLQRTRPVVVELAARLTGGPPPTGFVELVRERVDSDPFTRDVVVATVADVAFNGRIPQRRPPGAAWDRGLVWWAAALAGVSPAEFEARSAAPARPQPDLFAAPPASPAPARPAPATRAGLAAVLRQLLEAFDGQAVPASALQQLVEQLEAEDRATS